MHKILTHAGYHDNKPLVELADGDSLVKKMILPEPLTLKFDKSQRYCNGWHELETGESHVCPDSATIEQKFTQCPACQRRTGFNPAFYHASSVSSQQDKRNHQPHFLYLAYFAPSIMKVGISYAGRDNARLLEQGARAAYVLDTLPTALIARQYEEKIAKLEGIYEHLSSRRKRELWSVTYDSDFAKSQLDTTINRIADKLDADFPSRSFIDLNPHYFPGGAINMDKVVDLRDSSMISGLVVGCVGTDIIVDNDGRLFSLHLKHLSGYPVTISSDVETVDAPPVQASLF